MRAVDAHAPPGVASLPAVPSPGAGGARSAGAGAAASFSPPAPGLVHTLHNRPCNSAAAELAEVPETLAEVFGYKFPSRGEVQQAADGLQAASRASRLRALIEVSPGSIRIRPSVPVDKGDEPSPTGKSVRRGDIRAWSVKSRRQMMCSIAALDLRPLYESGRAPIAITLTYPGGWQAVAPDGEAVQAHLSAFLRRWERAWGEPLTDIWKREWQERGAPHFHLDAAQPAGIAGAVRKVRYEAALAAWEAAGRVGPRPRWRPAVGDGLRITQWVSVVWADVVNHPDPDQRAAMVRSGTRVSFEEAARYKDPKRVANYFTKHGLYRGKEYQNEPPQEWDGKPVGRFWGYHNLSPMVAVADIDGGRDVRVVKRTLRRWAARRRVWDAGQNRYVWVGAGKSVLVMQRRWNKELGAYELRQVKVWGPRTRLRGKSGTVLVNDGPAMARQLAQFVALTVEADRAAPVAVRWEERRRQRPLSGVLDQDFLCEVCGGTHPLREHRVCRARAEGKVMVR
jgi:hypothetical protein